MSRILSKKKLMKSLKPEPIARLGKKKKKRVVISKMNLTDVDL